MISKNLIITGRVQGVFFRRQTQLLATKLCVNGWVRNKSDGSVEVHAQGPEAAVQELIDWCRHGPDGAQVKSMQESDTTNQFCTTFKIHN